MLDAIGIVSENIEKSVEFYGLLGVSLEKAGGPDHLEGKTETGLRLMVDSIDLVKKLMPERKKPTGSGVVLCFKQDSPNAVDDVFSKITRAGFEGVKEPWDAFWGQRYACVKDPDGNQIDLFASLE